MKSKVQGPGTCLLQFALSNWELCVVEVESHGDAARALNALKEQCELPESELVQDGRLLPERELMEVLGVGRRALRHALDVMEAEGLIVRRQGHGTFLRATSVAAPSSSAVATRTSPAEILEVRRGLEPLLAQLAALRATPVMIERMKQLLDRGRKSKSGREYEKWDTQLHTEIARASNNHLFLALFEMVGAVRNEQGWSSVREHTFSPETRDRLVAQHLEIINAIADRNPEGAANAMRNHIANVTNLFGSL